jgi:general stress protein 26
MHTTSVMYATTAKCKQQVHNIKEVPQVHSYLLQQQPTYKCLHAAAAATKCKQ